MPKLNKGHKDPTYDNATGNVNREWKEMARLAVYIRERQCNPIWAEKQMTKFTGIFRRLLEDPIEEVKAEAGR